MRNILFGVLASTCKNFLQLSDMAKLIWAMSNPEPDICRSVAKYIHECFALRDAHLKSI